MDNEQNKNVDPNPEQDPASDRNQGQTPDLDLSDIFDIDVSSTLQQSKDGDFPSNNDDFFKILDIPLEEPLSNNKKSSQSTSNPYSKYISNLQTVLLAAIIVIVSILAYKVIKMQSSSNAGYNNQLDRASNEQNQIDPTQQDTNIKTPKVKINKALSLKHANNLFEHSDYEAALSAYQELSKKIAKQNNDQLVSDLLNMKMAKCFDELNHPDQAEKLYRIACTSDSPALAAIGYYYRALIEFERKLDFEARTYAYNALALCRGASVNPQWALKLQKNCRMLIAMSLTRRVLTLSDFDSDIPKSFWTLSKDVDPTDDMANGNLQEFLESGAEHFSTALLGPKVTNIDQDNTNQYYEVVCKNSPAEEALARFASKSSAQLIWNLDETSLQLRKKALSVYLPGVTINEFADIAAGCASLQANISKTDGKLQITITSPMNYTDLSEHLDKLNNTAVDFWKSFSIKYYNDSKVIAKSHYALGMLNALKGNTNQAISEFKLVSNQFAYSSLAPYALLNSSRVKAQMHDYSGAKDDLMQLVEQYNMTTIAQKACLYLADATYDAGLYDQAAKNYRKVYNLNYSKESKTAAALGAAKAHYKKGEYLAAEDWVTRYINMSRKKDTSQLHHAYLLLGKTELALNKTKEAFSAFKHAMARRLNSNERELIIAAMLESNLDKLEPVQALDIITMIEQQPLSQDEVIKTMLLHSHILSKMYLPEKAIIMIDESVEFIPDADLKARAYKQLGDYYLQINSIKKAHQYFSKALVITEPGHTANQITLNLAELSLKLDNLNDAIAKAEQILTLDCLPQIHTRAIEILAKCYKKQQNYEKAIDVLCRDIEMDQKNKERETVFERIDL